MPSIPVTNWCGPPETIGAGTFLPLWHSVLDMILVERFTKGEPESFSRGNDSLLLWDNTVELMRPWRQAAYTLSLAILLLSQVAPQSASPSNPRASKAKPTQSGVSCTNNGTYVNSEGQTVERPETCTGPPQGATAQCRDGSYSFSRSHRGTCSRHGGVAKWL